MAAVTSLYFMFSRSFCCDEAATALYASSFNYGAIISGIPGEYNPPLFAVLSKFGFMNYGLGYYGIRLLPVACYLISIIFFYNGSLRFCKSYNVASLATFIFAFLPINIFYSYQARAYSVMLMVCSAMFYFCCQIWTQEKKYIVSSVLYTLFLIFGVYCHYFVGLWAILLFLGLSFVIIAQNTGSKNYSRYLTILGANLVAFIVFLPELIKALSHLQDVANLDFVQSRLPWIARAAFNGYGLLFGEVFKPSSWRLGVVVVMTTSLIILISSVNFKNVPKHLWLALCVLFVGIFATSYLTVSRPMYGIFLTIPISIILATIFCRSTGLRKKMGISGFVACTIIILSTLIQGNLNSYFAPAYGIEYNKIYLKWSKLGNKKTALVVSPEWNKSIWNIYSQDDSYGEVIFFDSHQKGSFTPPVIQKEINSVVLIMEGEGQADSLDRYLREKYSKYEVLERVTYTSFLGRNEGTVYQIVKYEK